MIRTPSYIELQLATCACFRSTNLRFELTSFRSRPTKSKNGSNLEGYHSDRSHRSRSSIQILDPDKQVTSESLSSHSTCWRHSRSASVALEAVWRLWRTRVMHMDRHVSRDGLFGKLKTLIRQSVTFWTNVKNRQKCFLLSFFAECSNIFRAFNLHFYKLQLMNSDKSGFKLRVCLTQNFRRKYKLV